jgi:cytochrome P450
VWAIGRFQDVRAALRADAVLVSGRGVSLNPVVNGQVSRVTLTTDGDVHRRLRGALMKPMMPSTLREIEPIVQGLAYDLVTRLVERDTFDGVADFARFLPVAVVSHLVGLPEKGRERMLEWAAATFNALGPANERGETAIPVLFEMVRYAAGINRDELRADGWAARLFAAADEGRIDAADVAGMLIDYIAPSLDTTILGSGHLLLQLGRNPDQWTLVRSNPEWIPSAIDEALRLGLPVRGFTRVPIPPTTSMGPRSPPVPASSFSSARRIGTSAAMRIPIASTSPVMPKTTWPSATAFTAARAHTLRVSRWERC